MTGERNKPINVFHKKKPDGVNTADSRPDAELEDEGLKIWLIVDAKNYNSSNVPKTEEMMKDIKCRNKKGYAPTVGLMVCSGNSKLSKSREEYKITDQFMMTCLIQPRDGKELRDKKDIPCWSDMDAFQKKMIGKSID